MSYELTRDGQYAVDWDIVARLVESYWRARLQLQDSPVKSGDLPGSLQVDVDWNKLRGLVQTRSTQQTNAWRRRGSGGGTAIEQIARQLRDDVRQTPKFRDQFLEKLRNTQRLNVQAVEASAAYYGRWIERLRDVVRGSELILEIGATVAPPVEYIQGAFKAVVTYSETGHVGGAVMEATGAVAFHMIPEEESRGMLILAKGAWKSTTSLVEGKSLSDALRDGSATAVGEATQEGVLKVLRSVHVLKWLERLSVPLEARLKSHLPTRHLGKLVNGIDRAAVRELRGPGRVVGAVAVAAGHAAHEEARARFGSRPTAALAPSSCRFLHHAILVHESLLEKAIIRLHPQRV